MADSFLGFIPQSQRFNGRFWDISTLAMLSRSIFESYLLLYYFSVEPVTEDERELRKLAWLIHGDRENLKMLEWLNLKTPQIPAIEQKKARLQDEFQRKCADPKKTKRALNDSHGLLKDREKTAVDAGIKESCYRGVYKMLCSFTHPTPLGLKFLYDNSAGSQGALEQINILVQLTTGFLALTIRDFSLVFPDQRGLLPPLSNELIEHWEYIFSNWESNGLEQ
jgi:hypothetical protein